jgi:hypothetical protein
VRRTSAFEEIDAREPIAAPPQGVMQVPVGGFAHADVVVDVDQLAIEAVGEDAGYEQGKVAEALQRLVTLFFAAGIDGLGIYKREWFVVLAVVAHRGQGGGMAVGGEQVDDVGRGRLAEDDVLVARGGVEGVVKIFAHARSRDQS